MLFHRPFLFGKTPSNKRKRMLPDLLLSVSLLSLGVGSLVSSSFGEPMQANAEDSSSSLLPTVSDLTNQQNGYCSLESGDLVLRSLGDTRFSVNAVEFSFYNTLGLGSIGADDFYPNYSFSIGNYNLYLIDSLGNIRNGVTLHFGLYCPQPNTMPYAVRAQWYWTAVGYSGSDNVIARSTALSTMSFNPSPNELVTFSMARVGSFDGSVWVLNDSNNIVTDKDVEILRKSTSYVIGDAPVSDMVNASSITYPIVNAYDIASLGVEWHGLDYSVTAPLTYLDVDGYWVNTSTPDYGFTLIPMQVEYSKPCHSTPREAMS